MSRLHLPALCLIVAACAAPSYPQSWPVQSLVRQGDVLTDGTTVISTGGFAVNNLQAWRVIATTDAGKQVVVGPAGIVTSSHTPIPGLGAIAYESFDSVALDIEGNMALLANLLGTPASLARGFFINDGLILQESASLVGTSPAPTWLALDATRFADNGIILTAGAIAATQQPGIAQPAFIQSQVFPGGPLLSDSILIGASDELAPGIKVTNIEANPRSFFITDTAHTILAVDTDAPAGLDGFVLTDGQIIAREGAASPMPGRLWKDLSSPAVAIDHILNWALLGRLDGPVSSDELIVYNQAKFRQEGDPVPGLPAETIRSFGDGPIELDTDGDLLWFARWDSGAGLFVNDHMLVQEHQTMVAGKLIVKLFDQPSSYVFAEGGRDVLFEAQLSDGTRGVFMATEPISTVAYHFGCAPSGAQMLVQAGTPTIGTTIHVTFQQAQTTPALVVLALASGLALDPNGCGVSLPSIGEALIDLADPALEIHVLGTIAGPTFNQLLDIPNDPSLLGQTLSGQAIYLAPSFQPEPFRATNAVELTFGL